MMTAYQTIPNAVRAIRHGAEDYIVKEASVAPILERVLELRRRAQLREEAHGAAEAKCQGILGQSSAMRLVVDELTKVAAAKDTTLLLTGETGVGKEVACRFVHSLSRPAGSPLVVVDFLALPGPKGMSDDDVKKMYGKDYMAAEIGTLALDFRGRLAPRGWLSVPAIEAGLEGQLFAMSNKPDADDNGNVPKDYDKGTYGKEIDKTYYLGRAYLGLLGQFSFHDRVVLELGYRLSRWGGSFSFDDRARSISVLTEGANGSLCVGQSAKRDEGSIGLCFQLWADWPLGSNPNGAAGPGAFITGGQFTLTYRFGEMDTD